MAAVSFMELGKLLDQARKSGISDSALISVVDDHTIAFGEAGNLHRYVVDLQREAFISLPYKAEEKSSGLRKQVKVPARAARVSGLFTYVRGDIEIVRRSLPDILEAVLIDLEDIAPGTLERLSQIRPRTKRIVSRDPAHLFGEKRMNKGQWREIGDGWYMGTNNSMPETRKWIQRACECAGIDPIRDIRLSF